MPRLFITSNSSSSTPRSSLAQHVSSTLLSCIGIHYTNFTWPVKRSARKTKVRQSLFIIYPFLSFLSKQWHSSSLFFLVFHFTLDTIFLQIPSTSPFVLSCVPFILSCVPFVLSCVVVSSSLVPFRISSCRSYSSVYSYSSISLALSHLLHSQSLALALSRTLFLLVCGTSAVVYPSLCGLSSLLFMYCNRLFRCGTPSLGTEPSINLSIYLSQRVHALKELALDDVGSKAVFQAAGVSIVQTFGETEATRVPVLAPDAPYYSPSFVPGVNNLVVHARWSDVNFTTFELADLNSGLAYELSGVPLGRYFTPVISAGPGYARRIAFVKSAGDSLTGDILATARPGLYVGEINLSSQSPPGPAVQDIPIRGLRFIPSDVVASDLALTIRFISSSNLLVQESSRVFSVFLDAESELVSTIFTGKMTNEIAHASRLFADAGTVDHVAFIEYQHVYLASGTALKYKEELWAKPGNSTTGLMRLSVDGGHSLAWSRDGRRLSWLLGPIIYSLDISKVHLCIDAARNDRDTFGISCTRGLVDQQEIFVEHSTDIARLKSDASDARHGRNSTTSVIVAIHNATILTMETGDEAEDLIEHGVLLVQDGVISAVGRAGHVQIPAGAVTIDALGGFVMPGFIDVHAHWGGYTTRYPAKSWEMQTFLAYGVTTMHNPSSNTVDTFVERSRLESGQFIGPRILTTGTVVFAGTWTGLYEEIVDEAQALSALNRIKAEGGPFTLSYKNYQLPARASRQRLLTAAKELGMLCFPEGGANYDWNLAYIIDGMTTLEHTFPFASIYEDVSKLFVRSGTSYTPVYLVNYAGPWGEEYVWTNHDVPNDPKLRRFMRHDILEKLTESVARPRSSYVMFNASVYAAKMVNDGLKIHIGAHGEQPMGHNYHAEMFFTKSGGLTNFEVLQAATSNAASTLGILQSVGTLTAGKLADFLVYIPGIDILRGPIEDTTRLRYIVRGGRIWDADTMSEIWPVAGRKQTMPSFNPGS